MIKEKWSTNVSYKGNGFPEKSAVWVECFHARIRSAAAIQYIVSAVVL